MYGLLGAHMDARTLLLADVLAAEPNAHASHRSAAALVGLPGAAAPAPRRGWKKRPEGEAPAAPGVTGAA